MGIKKLKICLLPYLKKMEKNMYTGKGNHRINVPNTIHLTGWKFYSVIAGLVGSIGLMLWPIVMDPVLHVNKYS